MQREIINPWTWQEKLGFVHGNKVTQPREIFFLAGQTACDDSGHILYPGDMVAQIDRVLDNIGTILKQGDMDFSHVMRLNVYTTDMGEMMRAHDHMVENLQNRGCRHVGTLLGISALAAPDALVEMEVTAVK